MHARFTLLSLFATFFLPLSQAANTDRLDSKRLALVRARLAGNSTDSWVSGTRAEALLELDYPTLSVFGATSIRLKSTMEAPTETNQIFDEWAAQRGSGCPQFLCVSGGAAGDPASLGVAWILASVTEASKAASYKQMISDEYQFLTVTTKRTPDGAISMRPNTEPVQVWADFMYMVPPFLAYSGAVYSKTAMLQEAYDQCRLYRQYLQDPKTKLWKHIVLGDWQDTTLWGTGNAWAAGGIVRVLATMKISRYAAQLQTQIANLSTWANEIIDASFPYLRNDHFLPNQYDASLASSTFSDASSSALLAATALRLAAMGELKNSRNLKTAEKIREAVNLHVNSKTGWLSPVVDPLAWTVQTDQSPEGEAFVLLLDSAYRDYLTYTQSKVATTRHRH